MPARKTTQQANVFIDETDGPERALICAVAQGGIENIRQLAQGKYITDLAGIRSRHWHNRQALLAAKELFWLLRDNGTIYNSFRAYCLSFEMPYERTLLALFHDLQKMALRYGLILPQWLLQLKKQKGRAA